MSTARDLRRLLLRLACGLVLIGLAGFLFWHYGLSRQTRGPKKGAAPLEPEKPREIQFLNEEPIQLRLGTPLLEELKGFQGRRYELVLEEGQFAHVVVEQKGIDVEVRLQRPGQEGRSIVDSPNGREGMEIVFLLAQQAGAHRLEVVGNEPPTFSGHYEIRVEELRTGTAEDRAFFEAWKQFRRGEKERQDRNFREALGFFEVSLAAWKTLGRRDWEAETFHRIGRSQVGLGRSTEALQAYRSALPWFEEMGPPAQAGEILNTIGRLSLGQGDTNPAQVYGEKALAVFQGIHRPDLEADALHGLGDLWFRRGETEKAIDLLSRSRDLARIAEDDEVLARALHSLGEVYLYLGQFGPAKDSLEQALQLERREEKTEEEVQTLRALANVHLRQKDPASARRRLDEVRVLEKSAHRRDAEAAFLNSLGVLALEEGKPAEAKASFESALTLARETGNRLSEAFTLLNLGRALFDSKDVEGALRVHKEAAALFTQIDHKRGLVSTNFGSARALNALDRFEEAEQALREVGTDTELLRSGTESPTLRSTFFATKQQYFDLYVDVLMSLHKRKPETGYDYLALEVNERRRARSLLEELGGRVPVRPDADPRLVSRRRELESLIEDTERNLSASPNPASDDGSASPEEQRLRTLLTELDQVRTELRKQASSSKGLAEPKPLSLQGMQGLLDPDSVLLVFSLGEARSYLWCVAHHGRIESRILPGRSWIEARVDKLVRRWSDSAARSEEVAQAETIAKELSSKLLGPVSNLLGSRRLIIVADGGLQRLSFAALPDPGATQGDGRVLPLIARHEIAYLPSASVLAVTRRALQSRSRAPGRLIMMADPVFDKSDPRVEGQDPKGGPPASEPDLSRAIDDLGIGPLARLPFAGREAEAVGKLFPGSSARILLGFGANLDAIEKGALQPYSILHFATHGWVDPVHPELSGLVLSRVGSDGSSKRGFLRAHQIADLDLRADLAVLSACETGVGADLRGEGNQALTRSFLRAGVPRVVVSLWKVDDEATAILMERFYRGLTQHQLTASQALRCAQLSMAEEKAWADPFFWAPFVFQGEWENRVRKPPASDDSIEKQSGGGMLIPVPDDDFPPPGTKPPQKCPDLRGDAGGPQGAQ